VGVGSGGERSLGAKLEDGKGDAVEMVGDVAGDAPGEAVGEAPVAGAGEGVGVAEAIEVLVTVGVTPSAGLPAASEVTLKAVPGAVLDGEISSWEAPDASWVRAALVVSSNTVVEPSAFLTVTVTAFRVWAPVLVTVEQL
jgi:hypothetical protein